VNSWYAAPGWPIEDVTDDLDELVVLKYVRSRDEPPIADVKCCSVPRVRRWTSRR